MIAADDVVFDAWTTVEQTDLSKQLRLPVRLADFIRNDESNEFFRNSCPICHSGYAFPAEKHLLLQSTNMQYIMLKNTQKKGKVNDMPLAEYKFKLYV
jgi:hypothetical protein